MPLTIAIPKETHKLEKRVAATPDSVRKLLELGYRVVVESRAGSQANYSNDAYKEAGAEMVSAAKLYPQADILLKVNGPEKRTDLDGKNELDLLPKDATFISFLQPALNEPLLKQFAKKKINALAIDAVPRISRAQKMDALSSMANIAGYRAVVEASNLFGRFFTGQITAAGKVPPAKVLVIGAGVAGLSAIGAAKSMGAIVRAFDTRPEVKDQVKSMGAEFLELDYEEDGSGTGGYAKEMSKAFIDAEMALFREQAAEVDIIITTALIPGKPAPKLILEDMVKSMKQGSVIVDLAAANGGNCELAQADKVVTRHGVSIIGYTNLPSRLAAQSSQLYATNLVHLVAELTPGKDGELIINMDDEVQRGATVVHQGKVTWPPPQPASPPPSPAAEKKAVPEPEPEAPAVKAKPKNLFSGKAMIGYWAVAGTLLLLLGSVAPADFVHHFFIFILSIFVGWQLIWNVKHSLHTPLMSVTNAISSIVILGALLLVATPDSTLITVMAMVAVFVTSINIFGGFYVTHRMLHMFRK
ncbi:MAG: Re/Si-specific NAD(P)(+) transhydrogenase subunit alpha [Natronospirillum sp.]|uniref:Re/Si-specific NAD(P)(+) transhydrogenase subunit alpha n=1 Tax=Natronospirillum sp. TaxID=2812955 RepID=UPI0025D5253A|nr:Re/Si-specific NAD(P)(+) transhydrogenase subunit alpha [Natronospirillum sp.]MCH8551192.1 Re/Si-specific NAD(P)(+) transhydrogenase subunit alpha [Natronospirillum sp.]